MALNKNHKKFNKGNKYGGPLVLLIVGCKPVYLSNVSIAICILRRQRICNTGWAMNKSISDLRPLLVCSSMSIFAYAEPSHECRKCL